MQKLIIKLFRLTKIQGLLQKEREKQKARDEKNYLRKLKDLEEKYELELDYQAQSHGAELAIVTAELEEMRKREVRLNRMEARLRNQVKSNVSLATIAHSHIFNIAQFLNKESGEIHGLLDRVEREHKKLSE